MNNNVEMVVVNEGIEDLSNNKQNNNDNDTSKMPQTKHVLPHWVEIWSKIAIYIGIAICVFFFVAFIVAYGVFTKTLHERVTSIDKTCSNGDENVDLLKKPPRQKLAVFMYNISNPREYITGQTAKVHELGPYSMSLLPVRNEVVLKKSAGTVTFNLYNDITYVDEQSCPECNLLSPIYAPNVPYLALFSNAQNEASLMLSLTCSAKQIKNISTPGTSPTYCLPAQYNTAANCICCSANPSSPYTCNNIISPTSRVGGVLSWLSQYDNGFRVNRNINTGTTGFRLATGVFTSLVRKLTISEVVYGTVSSLLGFLNAATAVRSSDFKTLYTLSNTTNDLKDACSALCPTVLQLRQAFAANPTSPRSVNISCNGLVPSWEILNQTLKNEKRSLELRYLEGVDCKPFSVTLAINALLLLDPTSTKTCADGTTPSNTNPCCLKSYSSTSLGTGAGLGCHFWANGLIQSRRVYSNDEAVEYLKPSPETEFYTGCADPHLKFQQHIWRGQSQYDGWFTPATYKYPNMSWADPTIVKGGRAGTTKGEMVPFYVNGYQAALRSGRGITSNFGVYQLTNGKPKEKESNIWSPFKLGVTPVKYDRNRKVDGLETNHFLPVTKKSTDPEEIEDLQRHGSVPFQNMNNLVYSLGGIPVIMSYPNFYQSDESMLSQTNNLDKKSSSKAGVTLYRTRDGYTSNSPTLATPEPITTDVWDEYGEDNFRGYLDVEPATGLTLEGKIANQFSAFLWNCNPALDPSCGLARNTTTRSLCYTNGMLPCSFSNVFTPRVMGGKVLPIYWLYTTPGAPTDASDYLVAGVNARYALSILVVFVPALTFFITLLLLYCLLHHAHNPHLSENQPKKVPNDEKEVIDK